jgi:anti-sigma factor RsiW
MSGKAICTDKAVLVTYLYGECDEAARRAVDEHLTDCEACSAEIADLRQVRASLSEWQAPDRAPGLHVMTPIAAGAEAADGDRPSRSSRRAWMPGWLPAAAAAVLLLAAAAGLARIEVRYGQDGLVLRTGWGAASDVEAVAASDEWRQELAAVERDLRQGLTEVKDLTARAGAGPAATPAGSQVVDPIVDEDALLRRVQTLIDRSAQQQRRELAGQLADVVREVEIQRRADLREIQQTFGQLEGQTGIAVRQNQELFNYLVRVSQQR